MTRFFDALIVGAGIVGTACAAELATAGLSVGILERDAVGSGATAAGMGHIVVMDDSPAQFALTRYSQTLWDDLVAAAPARHEYSRCGTIWIASDDEEMQAVERKHAYYHAGDVPAELLNAAALYRLEPHLRPGLAGGLLVPGDGVVYPPRSAAALLERARAHGAHLIYGDAGSLLPDGVLLDDGRAVHGHVIVIANGIRALDLVPDAPIRARKGHLAITDRYPDTIRHQLVEVGYVKNAHAASHDSVAFNVQPRGTGQLLIGSSRQFDTSDAVDHRVLSQMLGRALEYVPVLRSMRCIRVWTGVRAATPDGLPLIGRHPSPPMRHVWLATGHEGLGITTAPATARLLAAQIFGHAPTLAPAPYLPDRMMQEAAHV